jgi:hypothetical protein
MWVCYGVGMDEINWLYSCVGVYVPGIRDRPEPHAGDAQRPPDWSPPTAAGGPNSPSLVRAREAGSGEGDPRLSPLRGRKLPGLEGGYGNAGPKRQADFRMMGWLDDGPAQTPR